MKTKLGRRAVAFVAAALLIATGCAPETGGIPTTTTVVDGPDIEGPTVIVPDPMVRRASGRGGAYVDFVVTAIDEVDGVVPVHCDPGPGVFPIGVNEVMCTATDTSGNASSASFSITVYRDTGGLSLELPDDVTVEATDLEGAVFDWELIVRGDVNDDVLSDCSWMGPHFPLGETTVRCWADDSAGNGVDASFTVRVVDTTAPVLDIPTEMYEESTDGVGAGASVWDVFAHDIYDGDVDVVCDPERGYFPIGTTLVQCSATDSSGNRATGTFTVTVVSAPPFGGE